MSAPMPFVGISRIIHNTFERSGILLVKAQSNIIPNQSRVTPIPKKAPSREKGSKARFDHVSSIV